MQRRSGFSAVVSSLLLWSSLTLTAAAFAEHDFVGVGKCKSCHKKELMGDQVASWRKGPHHRAYETLKNEASLAIATERGLSEPPHEAAECLVCHVTAYDVPPARIAHPVEWADGVQCESCHGPGRDYRKKKIMSDVDKARTKGLWDSDDPAICTTCHNEKSPTFDPARYTLADGTTSGFDFAQAVERIAHPIPEDVKGRYLELAKKLKEENGEEEE